jgi:hypothetical protein
LLKALLLIHLAVTVANGCPLATTRLIQILEQNLTRGCQRF